MILYAWVACITEFPLPIPWKNVRYPRKITVLQNKMKPTYLNIWILFFPWIARITEFPIPIPWKNVHYPRKITVL